MAVPSRVSTFRRVADSSHVSSNAPTKNNGGNGNGDVRGGGGRQTSTAGKIHGTRTPRVTGGVIQSRRFRPRPVYVREVRPYERGTEVFIRQVPFHRLVQRIAPKYITAFWFRKEVLALLQRISEAYLTCQFKHSSKCSYHGRRVLLTAGDVLLARRIRGDEFTSPNVCVH
ncbi:hypothetical protein HPB47_003293 [Ixodes persulcatus]|uniref:Uncharacterized protein n=1 Tax=Ixodes persulcatus TaxID=34615 RepID=A0AC60PK11_IXOPE|nr:hypothetical protein HPB47_003293 [Ixodes persulcatus]